MAGQGRRSVPTVIASDHPRRKARAKVEPKPRAIGEENKGGDLVAVEPPDHLTPRAKEEWRRLCPELIRLRLLTVVDLNVFASFCQVAAEIIECGEAIEKTGGPVLESLRSGTLYRNPHARARDVARAELIRLSDRLGFNPSARAGMSTKAQMGLAAPDGKTYAQRKETEGLDGYLAEAEAE
jgi:P27 family predicted phage terminase small subunit